MTLALASSSTIDNWPIFVLLISVAWVVFGITKLKLHPFLSLMTGAILVGWMTVLTRADRCEQGFVPVPGGPGRSLRIKRESSDERIGSPLSGRTTQPRGNLCKTRN